MIIGSGEHKYEWIEDWGRVPETEGSSAAWSHPGIAVTKDGRIVTYHQHEPKVLVLDQAGRLLESWETDLVEGHGITIVAEGDTEYLWIADSGAKARAEDNYARSRPPAPKERSGQVVKMTLDGRVVMRLGAPPNPVYDDGGGYSPTLVAVNEERHGGNGDVWVTDGYGRFYVHRYDKSGNYIASINGEEGAGHFQVPHAICVDTRKSEHELYVGDEWNGRIQVYDLEGNFKRAFGSDFLTFPSGLGLNGDLMMVMELGRNDLKTRLWLLDVNDNHVALLGDNPKVDDTDAWPNMSNDDGKLVRTSLIEPGKFHSPHMLAADSDGNIYIAEWLIGGRNIKLARQ